MQIIDNYTKKKKKKYNCANHNYIINYSCKSQLWMYANSSIQFGAEILYMPNLDNDT